MQQAFSHDSLYILRMRHRSVPLLVTEKMWTYQGVGGGDC
jgi:hypothetical protein